MGAFDEMDPLSLHMLGMHGSAYANYAMQSADCIVAVGARFDDRVTVVDFLHLGNRFNCFFVIRSFSLLQLLGESEFFCS